MAKTISQINTASDTFQVWVDRTNDLANVVSIEVVTANNETGGALTTGNAYVNGIFSVATLSANTELRGGNVDT